MKELIARMETGNWVVVTASMVCGLGLWVIFGRQLPPEVPMMYSLPWGESQLVKPVWLLLIPSLAVAAGVVTGGLVKLWIKETPLGVMMLASSMATQAVMMAGMLRIILAVI